MEQHTFRGVVRFVAPAVVATVVLFAVGVASADRPGSTLATFSTPGTYTWAVPNGVKQVTFDLFGAEGGTASPEAGGGPGGLGGEASATFNVQAGQVFEIVVGGGGPGCCPVDFKGFHPFGFNGGGAGDAGGGGATDVRAGDCAASMSCGLSARIIVAGGGGGGGIPPLDPSCLFPLGVGGPGGDGGGSSGGPGGGQFVNDDGGGGGGTQTSGGAGGGTGFPGEDGSFGSGGASATGGGGGGCIFGGGGVGGAGGGGGGWFGGGGGGVSGGGGGGSGFVDALAVSGTMQTGVHSGDGMVVITKP
jgi:hypothetical protein